MTGEFCAREERASKSGPAWMGRPAPPMAGCFVSWFERSCFLWDILHHFPPRSLFFSDLCTCRTALHLEFGMSGSFLSFRALPKYCHAELPWPPSLLLICLYHSLQFLIKFLLEYSLFYNVVLVSGPQQNEWVIRIHIPTLSKILFP